MNAVMLTTQDKPNLCCQRVARLKGQTSIGYDWERAVKVAPWGTQFWSGWLITPDIKVSMGLKRECSYQAVSFGHSVSFGQNKVRQRFFRPCGHAVSILPKLRQQQSFFFKIATFNNNNNNNNKFAYELVNSTSLTLVIASKKRSKKYLMS